MADQLPSLLEAVKLNTQTVEELQNEVLKQIEKIQEGLIARAKDIYEEMVRRGDDENARELSSIIKYSYVDDEAPFGAIGSLEYSLEEMMGVKNPLE